MLRRRKAISLSVKLTLLCLLEKSVRGCTGVLARPACLPWPGEAKEKVFLGGSNGDRLATADPTVLATLDLSNRKEG